MIRRSTFSSSRLYSRTVQGCEAAAVSYSELGTIDHFYCVYRVWSPRLSVPVKMSLAAAFNKFRYVSTVRMFLIFFGVLHIIILYLLVRRTVVDLASMI